MKYKVVYNTLVCGDLVLSQEAVDWLRSHGYTGPLMADHQMEWEPETIGHVIPRHHPLLVECVETLGEQACGHLTIFSRDKDPVALQVATITGHYYYIDDHDGAGEEVIDVSKMTDASSY